MHMSVPSISQCFTVLLPSTRGDPGNAQSLSFSDRGGGPPGLKAFCFQGNHNMLKA